MTEQSTLTTTEIFKSRQLATAIYNALIAGETLPLNVMNAYKDLREFYDRQMAIEYGEM